MLTPARAYDPNLGRWLSRDPIAEQGGANLYAYASNNPIDASDPTGLCVIYLGFNAWNGVYHSFIVTEENTADSNGSKSALTLRGSPRMAMRTLENIFRPVSRA
jgi:uncharacterized protein RhaS with RHS repeats